MNLFEQLAGKALKNIFGGAGAPDGKIADVIGELLGSSQAGGLDGLVKKFGAAGLDDIVKSWISTGANKAISPDQLSKVIDPATLSALAQKIGFRPDDLLKSLSAHLPGVVDALTPNGKLPDTGMIEQGLKILRGLK